MIFVSGCEIIRTFPVKGVKMEFGGLLGGADVACAPQGYYGGEKMLRQPNVKERLELAVKQAEEKLAAVRRAKEIFEKYPDIEELLNIMQRGNF